MKNGFGQCTWSNGACYEGDEYKDDVMHGKVKFRNSPGDGAFFVEGVWYNGHVKIDSGKAA